MIIDRQTKHFCDFIFSVPFLSELLCFVGFFTQEPTVCFPLFIYNPDRDVDLPCAMG